MTLPRAHARVIENVSLWYHSRLPQLEMRFHVCVLGKVDEQKVSVETARLYKRIW